LNDIERNLFSELRATHSEKKRSILGSKLYIILKLKQEIQKKMLNSHTIIAKRLKNIFQPADPTTLPESPQIHALSGAYLRDGLNFISQ
jgi:hypothetical protein